VLLDHLWLNAGFFPSMCGKDLFYSAGVKRGESDHCGNVLQLLPETVFLALTAVELGAMLLILLLKMSIYIIFPFIFFILALQGVRMFYFGSLVLA